MRRPGLSLAAVLCLTGCVATEEPSQSGTIRVALADSDCEDYCVDTVSVWLYRLGEPSAIGPGTTAPCGEEIVLEPYFAGSQFKVKALLSRTFPPPPWSLEGWSDPVTVPEGAIAEVAVQLLPTTPPELTGVAPEPLVLEETGAVLSVDGRNLGAGAGLSRAEIDGTPADASVSVEAWTPAGVDLRLGPGAAGSALALRVCGVATNELRLRLVPREPVQDSPTLLGCAGAEVRAMARSPDTEGVRVAVACSDAPGRLLTFLPDGCVQATGGQDVVSLGGEPVSLVAGAGGDVWIGIASGPGGPSHGLFHIEPGGVASPVEWDPAFAPVAMASSPVGVHVVGRRSDGATALVTYPPGKAPAFEAAGEGLVDIVALPAGAGAGAAVAEVFVAATDGVVGRLVRMPTDCGPLTPGCKTERGLTGCPNPVALDAGQAGWVAVACGGPQPGIAAVSLEAWKDEPVFVPASTDRLGAVALDETGDVAFAWAPQDGVLEAVHLPSRRNLAVWSLGEGAAYGRILLAGAGDRLLLSAGPAFLVVSPYAGEEPCP